MASNERDKEPSFTCPRCGARSFNPNDIANQYCGACHQFVPDQSTKPADRPHRVCMHCNEPISVFDDDSRCATFHRICLLRELIGSVGHQRRKCSCYGGTEEDPSGMTKRAAAKAAVKLYFSMQTEDQRAAFDWPGRGKVE